MNIPKSIKPLYRSLSREQKKCFRQELRPQQKSGLIALLAWLLLGWHYLYLRRPGTQICFWLTAGGFLVWWILDLFRLPGLIRNHNHQAARNLMVQFQALTQQPQFPVSNPSARGNQNSAQNPPQIPHQ